MPQIFDNFEEPLLKALRQALELCDRADYCVGYFNLRGWRRIHSFIEKWPGGEGNCCRLLVGMQRVPQDELRRALSLVKQEGISNKTANELKKRFADEFREQLTFGMPTNEDEAGLRRLCAQIRSRRLIVKLFLRHSLHAKLYLHYRPDPINPTVGYLGSSNLTLAGLEKQGELNIDVLDQDACGKLSKWFEDRWNDRFCVDISQELIDIIEESWAREQSIPPHHIYVKMAYHLAREARAGLSEFRIPRDFRNKLFPFQKAAVQIAAHHLNKRGGVMIGDVVGLGKTLMATALARIFQDDHFLETLIICPRNLVPMWEDYKDEYRLIGRVLSITQVQNQLPDLRRFRLIIIDESHNLRNRAGKRYRAIEEYIRENESKVILLSATPYNKTYIDLSNQLRLFIADDQDLGIRPEKLLQEMGVLEFNRRHQVSPRSLGAFEKSEYIEDWRELMRLFLVRRTRSFIKEHYAVEDPEDKRRYLTFEDGSRSYFPERVPVTVPFQIDDKNPDDQYACLYSPAVENVLGRLILPRYGLGNYVVPDPHSSPSPAEDRILDDLSRAGKRLMGFCRTNLFKRLESCGKVFLVSVARHILRNHVFLYAIENGLDLPIGTQDSEILDTRFTDADSITEDMFENDSAPAEAVDFRSEWEFRERAQEVYSVYRESFASRFRWLRSDLFTADLAEHLANDADALLGILAQFGDWNPDRDEKLHALEELLSQTHSNEKVIIFTQFADTVNYLESQLLDRGIHRLAGVTGSSSSPTEMAWRFSPVSNDKRERIPPHRELRVLIATDVLSEGQNLQDAHIVVNYDLPWAIIRLVQRAGRVDRIGQQAPRILCYSFLPADGVERIIHLRVRVRRRLDENAEVVGTDEAFFEDDRDDRTIVDLYNEKAGILDGDDDAEVDLASYAYQVWKRAIDHDPALQKTIPALPPVVFSTKAHQPSDTEPSGALLYIRTPQENDALAWVNENGESVTESQFQILKAAECPPDEPALPRSENHHKLVRKGVELVLKEEDTVGGQLGRPSGARFRTYERLKRYAEEMKDTLFATPQLQQTIEDIYRYPLRQSATDTLNRQLRSGIPDEKLAELVVALREEDRLCLILEEEQAQEPQIICSMGLAPA